MPKGAILALLAAVALAAAGCGGDDEEAGGAGEATVELNEQNASGQSGTATLTAASDATTRVVIELGNGTSEPQPAHVHGGSCDNLDPQPRYPLASVVDGKSETTIQAPLSELTDAAFAINVHKSEAEVQTYVACGAIGSGSGSVSNVRDY